MKNWKHWAGLYLLAGAGISAWAYSKGYAFQAGTIVTWPTKISIINALPKTTRSTPAVNY
jgi:hypothetical protein